MLPFISNSSDALDTEHHHLLRLSVYTLILCVVVTIATSQGNNITASPGYCYKRRYQELSRNTISDVSRKGFAINFDIPHCPDLKDDNQRDQFLLRTTCNRTSFTFCSGNIKFPNSIAVSPDISRFDISACSGLSLNIPVTVTISVSEFHAPSLIGIHDVLNCNSGKPLFSLVFSSNHVKVLVHDTSKVLVNLYITVTKKQYLTVTNITPHSGHVAIFQRQDFVLDAMDFWQEIKASSGQVIMISFRQFQSTHACWVHINPRCRNHYLNQTAGSRACRGDHSLAEVYNTTCLRIIYTLKRGFLRGMGITLFSIHSELEKPQKLDGGLFNCSVHFYNSFYQHLHCNAKPECEDGRDETESCPCVGLLISHNKCFRLMEHEQPISFGGAQDECRALGGNLASLKTKSDLDTFRYLQENVGIDSIIIGMMIGQDSVPNMYRHFHMWADNTMIYFTHYNPPLHSPSLFWHWSWHCFPFGTGRKTIFNTHNNVCELKLQLDELFPVETVRFSVVNHSSPLSTQTHLDLVICPDGHFTHTFLLCDVKSYCEETGYLSFCKFSNSTKVQAHDPSTTENGYGIVMFSCDDKVTTVSYTLVCDFIGDCPDDSDESFCKHPPCDGFKCANGQCVMMNKRCNWYSDCADDSDEVDCCNERGVHVSKEYGPYLINLDGKGYFTFRKMKASETCPDTHYRCPTVWPYCLPVYTRCNGFGDCDNHEDEQSCQHVTCPGFYRCLDSTVCVHLDHLCDGWSQCPHRDDEKYCEVICPVTCMCQGHAFQCEQPFPADQFPQLRYLDGAGSGITPSDLSNTTYLVRLSLSRCNIASLPHMKFPNLQFMDLSNNKMKNVFIDAFSGFSNLQILILADNPLMSLTFDSSSQNLGALRKLDLSRSHLEMLSSTYLGFFPQVQHLNVSSSALQTIGPGAFQSMHQLLELDLTGNPINQFPVDVFLNLNRLDMIYSSNYRICCRRVLLHLPSTVTCLAPKATFSTCENLLRSDLHRATFWLVGIVSLLGNSLCLIYQRVAKTNVFRKSFILFIVQLHLVDLCLGIHSSVIAVANEVFYGQYLHHEYRWINSVICKTARFFSVLSNEVSVLVIWFITLDHINVLYYPSRATMFNKGSAAAACGLTWVVGLLLASLTFLPGKSIIGSHVHTGICHLGLLDLHSFNKNSIHFEIIITFNFLLSVMITAGQVIISKAIPTYRTTADSNKKSVHYSGNLMFRAAITDAICWLLTGIISFMASAGVTFSGEIGVTMAVFVLPLNCALNPMLFVWCIVMNKQQQQFEERLVHMLKSQIQSSKQTSAKFQKMNKMNR